MRAICVPEAEQPRVLVDGPRPKAGTVRTEIKAGGSGLMHTAKGLRARALTRVTNKKRQEPHWVKNETPKCVPPAKREEIYRTWKKAVTKSFDWPDQAPDRRADAIYLFNLHGHCARVGPFFG